MRYRLRTLLIAATIGPPILAGAGLLAMAEPALFILAGSAVTAVYMTVERWLILRQSSTHNRS